MASATSFPSTMTPMSLSSFMDVTLNNEDILLETFTTDMPEFFSENSSLAVPGTNVSSYTGPVRDALYIVIPITILYSVIFLTGVVGNVVTCIVISRNKHMHTATNYYLFSLAVSDLLLLVTGLPQEMYSIWSRYPYVFGEVFCVLRGLAAETSANATVLTITAFTVERYVAICHPFLSHTMSKLSRAVKLILVIWIVALAFAVPQAIQFGIVRGRRPEEVMCLVKTTIFEHSFEISTFLFFVTPMTLITVLYALIGLRLRRSNMMKKDAGSFSCKHSCSPLTTTSLQQQSQRHLDVRKSNCCRRQQSQSSRRVLKMLVAVVVAFFICWAPFHAQRLVAIYVDQGQKPEMLKIYEIVTYISGILYYVSTTINPILYHTMSLKFREAFKDTLTRCCGFRGIKGHRARRSYSILSRSAQRGTMGACNAGQESTDYSGNSVREEVLPSGQGSGGSCRSSLKEPSGTRRSFRKQDSGYMTGGHVIEGKPAATNWLNPQNTGDAENIIQTNNYRRSYCRTESNESDIKTIVVHKLNQQNIRDSQRSLFNNTNTKKGKQKGKAESVWKVFHCVKSSTSNVKENKNHSISYSPSDPGQGRQVPTEVFGMISVCRSNSIRSLASSSNNVSNSSLRDVERGALEDELTAYMEELRRREMC